MTLVLVSTLPALLAADPSVAVLLSRRTAVSTSEAVAVTGQVTKALVAAQVPLLDGPETTRRLARVRQRDATLCAGKPPCLKELSRSLEVPWLVLVSVAQVAGDKSLGLELFDASAGSVAEVESLVLPTWKAVNPELLDAFAQRVLARTAPMPVGQPADPKPNDQPDGKAGGKTDEKAGDGTPGAPGDAPVATDLTPKEVPPTLPPEAPSKSHAASWVLGGAGATALVAAGVLLGIGLSTQASVSAGDKRADGLVYSDLTGSQAQARAQAAGMQLGIAGAAAAAAIGLGTAAILSW
ncbi:MAG: hypothetical protein AB1730_01520 [Myxococcota bacterium]